LIKIWVVQLYEDIFVPTNQHFTRVMRDADVAEVRNDHEDDFFNLVSTRQREGNEQRDPELQLAVSQSIFSA